MGKRNYKIVPAGNNNINKLSNYEKNYKIVKMKKRI